MTVLRTAGAAAALCVAAAHVPITGEHLHEAPYIGLLFIALEVACVALAAALVVRRDSVVWAAAGAIAVTALAAYITSRTVGLPQIGDDVGNWGEPLGVMAMSFESVLVLLSVVGCLGFRRGRRSMGEDAPSRFAHG